MYRPSNAPLIWLLVVAATVVSTGCRGRGSVVDNRFNKLSKDVSISQQEAAYPTSGVNPVFEDLSGPHSLEEYLRIGLRQNSEIQEVRMMVESLANRVPQAASLPDPNLNATTFPEPIQTAAGEQQFGLAMSQKVPWRGKLATRAAMAEDEVNAGRARLAGVELKVVEQIKNAYYELFFVQQSIRILEEDNEKLEAMEAMVDRMYRVKRTVTQQDVLQVQVAIARVETERVQLKQKKESAQARLARLLHISPDTQPEALETLPIPVPVQGIQELYRKALESKPELHAQILSIKRDRKATCLAELKNYPDLNFGFNWISTAGSGVSPVANGDDAFMLTLGMNLPVYRKRLDAGVREAQTRALSSARKYDRLKDETLEGVADLFAKIRSQQETLRLFREDIIPKQRLVFKQSEDDYQVGKTDFLQMIESWRQLLRYQLEERRADVDLHKSLAALAREMGEFEIPGIVAPGPISASVVPQSEGAFEDGD